MEVELKDLENFSLNILQKKKMRKCVWKRPERMCSLTFDKISVGSYHKLKQPSQWKPGAILQDNGRMTKEGDLEIIMAVIATTDPECKGPRSTALSE